ncbi:MAG: hypothetical protein PUP91_25340 [Rhizonema sp. PD37]|nr:hypothetical protein [Rhizonema sp. PD37]
MERFQDTVNKLALVQTCRQGHSVITEREQAIKVMLPDVQAPSLIPQL